MFINRFFNKLNKPKDNRVAYTSLVQDNTINKNTAFFRNGFLYDVKPRNKEISLYDDRGIAYSAKFIVSDGISYNLECKDSIAKIMTPTFCNSNGDTVGSLDYILRMCASNLRNEGKNELSICVLQKAIEIMPYSGLIWKTDDYLRIVSWLYEDGRFEDGDRYKKYILNNKKFKNADISYFAKEKFRTLTTQTDLIAFCSYSGCICETCAKYAGRVYSVSGKDKRFPKLPPHLKECGCFHVGCNSGASKYWEGDPIIHKGKHVLAYQSSMRPYFDDRTNEEKKLYLENQKRLPKDPLIHLTNKKEYYQIKYTLPDVAPKSLSGYVRMKNLNSDNFQKIKKIAQNNGIVFSE